MLVEEHEIRCPHRVAAVAAHRGRKRDRFAAFNRVFRFTIGYYRDQEANILWTYGGPPTSDEDAAVDLRVHVVMARPMRAEGVRANRLDRTELPGERLRVATFRGAPEVVMAEGFAWVAAAHAGAPLFPGYTERHPILRNRDALPVWDVEFSVSRVRSVDEGLANVVAELGDALAEFGDVPASGLVVDARVRHADPELGDVAVGLVVEPREPTPGRPVLALLARLRGPRDDAQVPLLYGSHAEITRILAEFRRDPRPLAAAFEELRLVIALGNEIHP